VRSGEREKDEIFRRYVKIWGGEKRITGAADHLAFCDKQFFSEQALPARAGRGGASVFAVQERVRRD
jgi:hypothetical protein